MGELAAIAIRARANLHTPRLFSDGRAVRASCTRPADEDSFKGTNDINGGAENVNNLGCRHLFFCRYLQSVPIDSALFMKPVNDVINAGTSICHKDGSNISGIEVSCI